MVELVLKPRAALDRCAIPMRLGSREDAPGVTLRFVRDPALAMLVPRTGRTAAVRQTVEGLGLGLPEAGRALLSPGLAILWAGPGQWLLVADPQDRDTASRLRHRLASDCMILDQSDARAVLEISGPEARACLAKGFSIDLHARAFAPGAVAMTIVAGIAATIWQIDDAPAYRIAVPRSTSEGFWHWLTESAAEYGCEVTV